jgi:hypothetical protein
MESMGAWLRFLFGLDAGEVPAGAESRLELTGMPRGTAGWLALLVLAAAIAFIVALYRRERELGRLQRTVLASLRLAALAVVCWMLLDPRMLTVLVHKRPAHTLVLLDTSASMAQVDPLEAKERAALEAVTGLGLRQGKPRAELALAALEHAGVIERLAEKNRVAAFTFDEVLRAVEKLVKDAVPAPRGQETRLGDALRGAIAAAGAEPIAAAVLLTDGRSNGGERLDRAAAEAALRGVPVHAVLVGRSRDPKNLAVLELAGPDLAEPGVPLRIQARVEVGGTEEPAAIKLSRQPLKGGARETVEARQLDPSRQRRTLNLVFGDKLPEKGVYRYFLTIERQAGETSVADNQKEVRVTAAEERCRVLVLTCAPNSEYRFLTRYLIREDGLQVSCWNASSDPGVPQDGDVVIREVPQSAEKLRPYDTVVLFDPDARVLSSGFVEALRAFVLDQGGGLALVAGEYNSRGLFENAALGAFRGLLPVDGVIAATSASGRPVKYTRPLRPRLTPAGSEHPALRFLDDPEENARLWSVLPGLRFSLPGKTLKPAATSLCEKDGQPLVAVQKAGAGYTAYVGSDDFSEWRSIKQATIQERFWGSLVRYLALGKKASGTGEAAIFVDRDRYTVGEEVVLEASLTDADRQPLVRERLEVALDLEPAESSDGAGGTAAPGEASSRLNLLKIVERPGWYRLRLRLEQPGIYTARVSAGGDAPQASATFQAAPPTTELSDPSPDPAALEELARRTGGRYHTLPEIALVCDAIGDRSSSEVIGRSSSTLWDSAALMMLFCVLLTVEWGLRKLWRLN